MNKILTGLCASDLPPEPDYSNAGSEALIVHIQDNQDTLAAHRVTGLVSIYQEAYTLYNIDNINVDT